MIWNKNSIYHFDDVQTWKRGLQFLFAAAFVIYGCGQDKEVQQHESEKVEHQAEEIQVVD